MARAIAVTGANQMCPAVYVMRYLPVQGANLQTVSGFTSSTRAAAAFTDPQQSTGQAGPADALMDGNFEHTAMS